MFSHCSSDDDVSMPDSVSDRGSDPGLPPDVSDIGSDPGLPPHNTVSDRGSDTDLPPDIHEHEDWNLISTSNCFCHQILKSWGLIHMSLKLNQYHLSARDKQ